MVHPLDGDGAWNVASPSDMATEVSTFELQGEASSLGLGVQPMAGIGLKGGFLYIRVLEAGNLGFDRDSERKVCSSCFCLGCSSCSKIKDGAVQIAFSCLSLERSARTKAAYIQDGRAVFGEEMLLRALNFCSADRLQVTLETKATVLEASMPLRAGLPPSLMSKEDANIHLEMTAWPPQQRLYFQGETPAAAYLDIELLQLLDGSMCTAMGAAPLLSALQRRQEQLIRGYLAFDYVERLSLEDQALVVASSIKHFPNMLLQLLDQIQPCQEHLLMAIKLGADQLLEPLLQAGGMSMLMWDEVQESEDKGDPPMVMVIRSKGSLQSKLRMIATLTRHGFSVDARSPADSWTPLLAAVESGSRRLVTALLQLGARLSADRHLGFTPLHLACQMGHWQLLPCLVEAMQKQYERVAAWGPSPQYISLNVADAYGRTPLDIALLRYFSSPDDRPGDEKKALDVLRDFLRERAPEDGLVCGWELFHVLNFIDAPSKKALRAQMECEGRGSPSQSPMDKDESMEEPQSGEVEEVLQAIRLLLQAGAQTRWLQDFLEPGNLSSAAIKATISNRSLSKFPALDAELEHEEH
ncbi:unnamed protein product [Cladocopium goreaui]|uniref:Succinate semialdehyde dehydrogenase [NAD(P)+] Sad n=1 Tax=Cladocopium goreaui TaxID=2562237 RepID=A0A9P1GQH3_9DINO|nr:unnamed protein product [Cladocopium goreaui]